MARTIFRFRLNTNDHGDATKLYLPVGNAKFLALHAHHGGAESWWEVEANQPEKVPLTIHTVGTGLPLPFEAHVHLGTVPLGAFVWHFYGPHPGVFGAFDGRPIWHLLDPRKGPGPAHPLRIIEKDSE